jgi:hypothetical protein
MQKRFAAGDADHWRAAFINGFEALLGRELFLKNVRGVLDLATAGTGQIASKQGLEHQHKRVPFSARELLAKHIARYRPHLRNRNAHFSTSMPRIIPEQRWGMIYAQANFGNLAKCPVIPQDA